MPSLMLSLALFPMNVMVSLPSPLLSTVLILLPSLLVSLSLSVNSITSNLAKRVGGWDPDWISEDWHMFLKCFLNTGGQVTVVPILLPVVNYTPEDETWWGTVWARWTQVEKKCLCIFSCYGALLFISLVCLFLHRQAYCCYSFVNFNMSPLSLMRSFSLSLSHFPIKQ